MSAFIAYRRVFTECPGRSELGIEAQREAVDRPWANQQTIPIMAAFAEHEREMIPQRTKARLALSSPEASDWRRWRACD